MDRTEFKLQNNNLFIFSFHSVSKYSFTMTLHEYTTGGDGYRRAMPVLDRDTCKTACEQDLTCIAYTVLTRNYGTECRIYYHGDFIAEENLNWSQNAESGTKAYKIGLYL